MEIFSSYTHANAKGYFASAPYFHCCLAGCLLLLKPCFNFDLSKERQMWIRAAIFQQNLYWKMQENLAAQTLELQ